jgi:hypothetical protein
MEKRTRQTLNIPGFAHGLPTAPLASCRIEAAGGGAVDIHGRPPFAKPSCDNNKQVKIACIHPVFSAAIRR